MLGDIICSDPPLHIKEKDGVGGPLLEGARGEVKDEGGPRGQCGAWVG